MTIPLPYLIHDPAIQGNFDELAKQFPVNGGGGGGGAPSGPAGGDLGGSYPDPTVTKAQAGFTIGGVVPLLAGTAAGGQLTGTYPNPQVASLVIVDGHVSATAAIAESKLNLATDAAAGVGSRRTLGTGALQAAAGNDSRLSDARTPTGSAGGDLAGTYPNPTVPAKLPTGGTTGQALTKNSATNFDASWTTLGGGAPSGPAGGDLTGTYPNPTIAALAVTDAKVAAANKDGAAATPSMRTLGTGATQATAGNDSRLTNARTPTAHASTHQDGGSDVLTVREAMMATAGTGLAKGAMRAYRNTAVSVASSSAVQLDAEDFDVSGWHATTTGYTPLVPGYYRISWSLTSNVILTADVYWLSYLRKNGAEEALGTIVYQRGSAFWPVSTGSVVVQANGTTDAFMVGIQHGTGGSAAIMTGRARSWMSANLIGRS